MLDLLIALLKEMFGDGDKKNAPQPRRRVRPPAGGGSAGPARPPAGNPFEDMVKELFSGIEEEKEEVAPPPPPPPPPPQPKPAAKAPPRQPVRERKPKPEAKSLQGSASVQQAYERAMVRDAVTDDAAGPKAAPAAPGAKTSEKHAIPDLVRRLRKNPSAAREALVYAEIFGPPVADRRDHEF